MDELPNKNDEIEMGMISSKNNHPIPRTVPPSKGISYNCYIPRFKIIEMLFIHTDLIGCRHVFALMGSSAWLQFVIPFLI